ncbi:twitchin, partial [Trichonephila inaurata madagascariensis]
MYPLGTEPPWKGAMTELRSASMISEPSRPEGPLVITDIDASSVHLSWKPPLEDNGGPILGYLIEAKDVLHMD